MTGRVRVRCRVAVTLEAPFLMRGIEGLGFGVDAAQLRDASGNALIPGDQLKGLLRQAVRDLKNTGLKLDEKAIFGRSLDEAKGQPGDERGHIVVSDLVAACQPTEQILPRVAIDGETGSAKSGHLLMIESMAPIGERVTFTGELVVFAEAADVHDRVQGLRAALQLIPAIGAMETAGFGRVVEAVLEKTAEEPLLPASPAQRQGGRLAWSFGFDRPLLVSAERPEANVLVGAEVISGAVLKGALARRLELAGLSVDRLLDNLRVGHAFPRHGGLEHGRALPLSLVTDRQVTRWEDALRWEEPLFDGEDSGIPLFRPDWKGGAEPEARQRLGIGGGLAQVTRTRTAIDPEHGRADEGNLFSFRMIDPTDVRWRAVIDTGSLGGTDLQILLAILAEGLEGVGKTDAVMVEPSLCPAAEPDPPQPVPGTADQFALMLETPALLVDTPALASAETLRQAFQDYFGQHGLTCVRFFAQQSWAGGIVAMKRDLYRPFVLVDAGSCFLLEGDPAPIAGWLCHGLPLPPWAIKERLDWQKCRYLPENGFAAVSLNRARPFWGAG